LPVEIISRVSMFVAVILTVVSGVDYFIKNKIVIFKKDGR